MKHLEDRIKDRLEGYESSLPEGDLAEFKSMLDKADSLQARHGTTYLTWLIPATIAAGLALFFILRPGTEQDKIQVADNSALVADIIEPETPAVIAEEYVPEVIAENPKRPISAYVPKQVVADIEEIVIPISEDRTDEIETEKTVPESDNKADAVKHQDSGTSTNITGASPFVESQGRISRKPISVNVGKATAGVLGGTGVVALTSILPTLMKMGRVYDVIPPDDVITDPKPLTDNKTGNDTHHMPLRSGLSLRIPFNDRWSLTTGVDYTWYSSSIEYTLSGVHKQNVHYLGIPVRADFTIARNRWMDVYVGAGASADLCVVAYEAGQKIARDGVGFSLIGAGGIQFNINKNFGLFLDPTLSWDLTSGSRNLDTFKSEHPLMLSFSTGVRLTVPNKK